MKMIARILISLMGLQILLGIGCGPVNRHPVTPVEAGGVAKAGATTTGIRELTYSDNQLFAVSVELQPALSASPGDDSSQAAAPVIGKNQYLIHFVHADDLSAPSADAHLSADYVHEHAKIPKTFDGEVERQTDGGYLLTVYFMKKGTWKIRLHMKDPGTGADLGLKDEHTISITL